MVGFPDRCEWKGVYMQTIKMLSWNINGVRAIFKKGFLDWFLDTRPDILCLQETKANEDQIPEPLKTVDGYTPYFVAAEKKGYSGVGLYTREKPETVKTGLGIERFDSEGRTLIADFGDFILYNIYFPNGKASPERLSYKMDFYEHLLAQLETLLDEGRRIIVCGDVNTAHTELDIARPKENESVSGFLPEERAWIDRLLSAGFLDTFRKFEKDGNHYTWWDYKTRARERNVGWRIDYFFISQNLSERLASAFIMNDVPGSDHCPIGIEIAGE